MEDLSSLKLPELKKECKARGLPITGNKADLVSRLQAAMSTEKPPSDDSVLDDALIDEDSMLGDDSGAEEDAGDLNDITTNSIDLSSPTSKSAPTSIQKISASPVKSVTTSPVKKVEPIKRPAPSSPAKTQNGTAPAPTDDSGASPAKKKITINREAVQAVPTVDRKKSTENPSSGDESGGEKKVVKIGSAPLTAEEKAKLRAQKFGVQASAPAAVAAATSKPAQASAVAAAAAPILDERMKKRAERFNNGASAITNPEHKVVSLTTEDDIKLAKRKERFGIVDDQSKKDTRAARFGGSTATVSAAPADSNDKKQLRAARFGSST